MGKKATSFRLSDDALRILKELADSQGISQTAVLEILIREEGKRKKVG